jgi:hypothetical protein
VTKAEEGEGETCTGAEEAAVEGGLAEGAADRGHAEDGLRRGFHGLLDSWIRGR